MISSVGDLSQSLLLRSQNRELKLNINELAQELSSGRVADLSRHLGGNLARINEVGRQIESLKSYEIASSEIKTKLEFAQISLDQINSYADRLLENGPLLENTDTNLALNQFSEEARQGITAIVAALNQRSNGVSIFAGTDGASDALAPAETFLNSVSAFVTSAGVTSASDVENAINDWFNTPGGLFESVGYLGNQVNPSPRQISAYEEISFGLRADDQRIRDLLSAFALSTFAADAGLALSEDVRKDIAKRGVELTRSANDGIIEMQSEIGVKQQVIEKTSLKNSVESYSLQLVYNDLTSVDPYDTATKFEESRNRLETHYTITARVSGLSLVNFIR